MPLDPDLVRVDLLKVKRKIFLSYPEDSRERQDFLLASKISEIGYLSSLIPHEVADTILAEHKRIIKFEIIDILVNMGVGIFLSVELFWFHRSFPKLDWLSLAFLLPFGIALTNSLRHVKHIFDQQKNVKPFKDEYEKLQSRINKLNDELRKLE